MLEDLRVPVSAYQRTRMVHVRLARGERRRLVVDFGASVGPDRAVTAVTWRANHTQAVAMSGATVSGRLATIWLIGQWATRGVIRCEATMDDGTQVSQLVVVEVDGPHLFEGEASPVTGPRTLTVIA